MVLLLRDELSLPTLTFVIIVAAEMKETMGGKQEQTSPRDPEAWCGIFSASLTPISALCLGHNTQWNDFDQTFFIAIIPIPPNPSTTHDSSQNW